MEGSLLENQGKSTRFLLILLVSIIALLYASSLAAAQTAGSLNVNLTAPSRPASVVQNSTFDINASITCDGTNLDECGWVNTTARYNASSSQPDTPIPNSSGSRPFHTTRASNPKSCPDPLTGGDSCKISWDINATGSTSKHLIDVNFTSNRSGVASNSTSSEEINILDRIISLTLGFRFVNFGKVIPGVDGNEATENSNQAYSVTLESDTTPDTDIWINGSDLESSTPYTIGASNISWNDTENTYSGSSRISHSFSLVRRAVSPGSTFDFFFWLDAPLGMAAADYNGTIWVKANETS